MPMNRILLSYLATSQDEAFSAAAVSLLLFFIFFSQLFSCLFERLCVSNRRAYVSKLT